MEQGQISLEPSTLTLHDMTHVSASTNYCITLGSGLFLRVINVYDEIVPNVSRECRNFKYICH